MKGPRIVDKASKGQDLRELNDRLSADADVGPLTAELKGHFFRLAGAIDAAMTGDRVQESPADLSRSELMAIELLYAAKSAREADTGAYISAIERSNKFNQALMVLQPVLALGLRPDFRDGRSVYNQLVKQLNVVKGQITAAIWAQIMPKKSAPKTSEEPADADGDNPANLGSGDDNASGQVDTAASVYDPDSDQSGASAHASSSSASAGASTSASPTGPNPDPSK